MVCANQHTDLTLSCEIYKYVSFFLCPVGTMVNPGGSSQPPAVGTGSLSWKRCAGCGGKIADRFLLYTMESYWHSRCLKCSCCQAQLGEIGTSCYTKSGMILCRNDYIRWDVRTHSYLLSLAHVMWLLQCCSWQKKIKERRKAVFLRSQKKKSNMMASLWNSVPCLRHSMISSETMFEHM